MKLSNENVFIASLMGSKVMEQLPRFAAVQNDLQKHVLPPVRFLPLQSQPDKVAFPDYEVQNNEAELWMNDKQKSKDFQFFPLQFKTSKEKQYWLFPWEPMINIEAKTKITKRYVAKQGAGLIGSIKERWSTDDYYITITGAFFGDKMLGKPAQTYPRIEMEKLRDYLLSAEAIQVLCEPLQILNINKIVIESVSFPFTKGENVQAYEIRAISDFPYDLIYKRKKGKLDMGDIIPDR